MLVSLSLFFHSKEKLGLTMAEEDDEINVISLMIAEPTQVNVHVGHVTHANSILLVILTQVNLIYRNYSIENNFGILGILLIQLHL